MNHEHAQLATLLRMLALSPLTAPEADACCFPTNFPLPPCPGCLADSSCLRLDVADTGGGLGARLGIRCELCGEFTPLRHWLHEQGRVVLYPIRDLLRDGDGTSTRWEECAPEEAERWCLQLNLVNGPYILGDFETGEDARRHRDMLGLLLDPR